MEIFETVRQQQEAEFHDRWATSIDVDNIKVKEAFESPTAVENQYILSVFGELKGKRILDLGCGMGDAAIFFALQGATVHAVDISLEMVKVTRCLADQFEVSESVCAQQMPAESLDFEDNHFDLIYGNGVLHHIDFIKANYQVFRVLKPGGLAAFIEPLTYNPFIWLYRVMARSVRSDSERPLSANDILQFSNSHQGDREVSWKWSNTNHKEFHMFTLLIMVWFLIGERILPSEERYWKRFVESGYRYESIFRLLYIIDSFVHRILPISRWLCWNTVLILEKPAY